MSTEWLLILLAVVGNAAWAASNWWVAIKVEHQARQHAEWMTARVNELNHMLESTPGLQDRRDG